MRDISHYANSASMSFAEVLTSSGTTLNPTKHQIHLAITSDNVVTETSVGLTNVTNVTTLGVVFYQQQTTQRNKNHWRQTSNHNKHRRVF